MDAQIKVVYLPNSVSLLKFVRQQLWLKFSQILYVYVW